MTETPTAVVAELSARLGGEVPELSVSRPSLEDVYLRLVGPRRDRAVMSTATTHARAPRGAPPSGWRIGWLRIGVELKQFFRDRESAVFNFLLPVLLLVVFGSVFGDQNLGEALDITFAQYFVAGMIASGILYTSFQNLAIAIPLEREDGTLKRLRGTPMPKFAYFLGKIGLVFVAYVAQVAILIAVGVLFYKIRVPDTPAAVVHLRLGERPGSAVVHPAWARVLQRAQDAGRAPRRS